MKQKWHNQRAWKLTRTQRVLLCLHTHTNMSTQFNHISRMKNVCITWSSNLCSALIEIVIKINLAAFNRMKAKRLQESWFPWWSICQTARDIGWEGFEFVPKSCQVFLTVFDSITTKRFTSWDRNPHCDLNGALKTLIRVLTCLWNWNVRIK